jgi:hypothetical protein
MLVLELEEFIFPFSTDRLHVFCQLSSVCNRAFFHLPVEAGHIFKAEKSLFFEHLILLNGIISGHFADRIKALHEPEADVIHKDHVDPSEVCTHHGLKSDANVVDGVQFTTQLT